jgi:hypothetical protein
MYLAIFLFEKMRPNHWAIFISKNCAQSGEILPNLVTLNTGVGSFLRTADGRVGTID